MGVVIGLSPMELLELKENLEGDADIDKGEV